jgi:hypothetical protein
LIVATTSTPEFVLAVVSSIVTGILFGREYSGLACVYMITSVTLEFIIEYVIIIVRFLWGHIIVTVASVVSVADVPSVS